MAALARKAYAGLSKDQIKAVYPVASDILRSHYISKCLSIAIRLDVATIIGKSGQPLSTEEIAKEAGNSQLNLDYLRRILRLLSSKGIFNEHCGPKFSLTDISQIFRTDVPGQLSMRCGALWSSFSSFAPFWGAFGHLEDCVFSEARKVPFSEANGKPFFDYLAENPEELNVFNAWMKCTATDDAKKICELYSDELEKLKPGTRFMDVGGGEGIVMKTVKDAYPGLHCIVFDLPQVVSKMAHKPDNIEFLAGDFFESDSLPKVDIIIMKRILHDWGDEECVKILRSCVAAVPRGGKILIADRVIPEPGEQDGNNDIIWDIQMLMIGGMERTLSEWKKLFSTCGLEFVRFIPDCVLIETVKL